MIERDIRLDTEQFDPFLRENFSREMRRTVRLEQGGMCLNCGAKPQCLQVHHKLPEVLGHAIGLPQELIDSRDNAIGLCPECHTEADELALNEGILYPAIPLEDYSLIFGVKKEKRNGNAKKSKRVLEREHNS